MSEPHTPVSPRPGDVYDIPVEGSLGLLALGAVGLKAWRDVRDRQQAKTQALETVAPVIIVSGLPRSGTSMMMQMLQAGGLSLLTDDEREADASNPRGYLEYEKVKHLARDNTWVKEASGQAVKIIAPLLPHLPNNLAYRVVFMERDLEEVLASQDRMLDRLDQEAADPALLKRVYPRQLDQARRWLDAHPRTEVCSVSYTEAIRNPAAQASRVAAFLEACTEQPLNVEAMTTTVDPTLYRERTS